MKSVFVFGAILLHLLARQIGAQVRMVDDTSDVRIAVLNTILASRIDLVDGSHTMIAACSLHGAEYYFPARANIDERFRKLLVRPEKPDPSGRCVPEDFADNDFRVLFFEEPRNVPNGTLLGSRVGRDVVLHVIAGPDYRESGHYQVSSEGIVPANGRPGDSTSRFATWRVREFKLLEVQLHWADVPKKVIRMPL